MRRLLDRLRGLDAALVAGLVLIAIQLVIRAVIVLRGYFWQDDFVHLAQVQADGFSADYLFQDYNDHLEPAKFAVVWLVSQLFGFNFTAAAVSMLVLQAAASLLLLFVLRLLFGPSPTVLLPFAAYLMTPLMLPAGTWWAASLEALPLQIAMLAAIAAGVQYLQTGRKRWGLTSWAAFALGLLCWEKAILILPALVGCELLVRQRGFTWRKRLRGVWDRRAWWLGHVAIAVAYAAAYLALVDFDSDTGSARPDLLKVANGLVLHTLLPGLLGGPWTGDGAGNTLVAPAPTVVRWLAVIVVIALVAASVRLRGLAAVGPWAFAAVYVAADLALVTYGRADFAGFLSRDPRYISDAIPLVVIAAAGAFAPSSPDPGARHRWEALVTPSVVAMAVTVLGAGAIITTTAVADDLRHEYARSYTTTALDAVGEDPTAVLVDSSAPPVEVVAQPVRVLFEAAGRDVAFDEPSTHLEILDGFGQPQPVTLLSEVVDVRGPRADCGWLVRERPTLLTTSADGFDDRLVLRVGYLSGTDQTLAVTVGGQAFKLSVPAGLGQAFFPLEAEVGPVPVSMASLDSSLCVSDIAVGEPWPA